MTRENETPNAAPALAPEAGADPPFPIYGYLIINVVFWLFCALEILLVRAWIKETQGVVFFFVILAIGFTVVSIFDCIYDRLTVGRHPMPDA
ncbi:MAG: hypothetical protein N3D11_13525 [Candidatus Sumerlaeia bacterium]|nr:hypothetical protein [Candidatus Sumerlaeia bacterium]